MLSGFVNRWAKFHGIETQSVYRLINLRDSPFRRADSSRDEPMRGYVLRPVCQRIAALLNADPWWLFPPELYGREWPAVTVDLPRWCSDAGDKLLLDDRRKELVEKALSSIPLQRDADVIRVRFGLCGEARDHTLGEVAERFAVSPERARQLELRALRKLRHPTRSRALLEVAEV